MLCGSVYAVRIDCVTKQAMQLFCLTANMLSTLVWRSVNSVVGFVAFGDLLNDYRTNVALAALFKKSSGIVIPFLFVSSYENKKAKRLQADQNRLPHLGRETFPRLVMRISPGFEESGQRRKIFKAPK